jgi:hypothetical protein
MSQKKKQVILNGHQLMELKWFCQNVVGTRQEFYDLLDKFVAYKAKVDRLHDFSKSVSKFLKEVGEDGDIKSLFDNCIVRTTGESRNIVDKE